MDELLESTPLSNEPNPTTESNLPTIFGLRTACRGNFERLKNKEEITEDFFWDIDLALWAVPNPIFEHLLCRVEDPPIEGDEYPYYFQLAQALSLFYKKLPSQISQAGFSTYNENASIWVIDPTTIMGRIGQMPPLIAANLVRLQTNSEAKDLIKTGTTAGNQYWYIKVPQENQSLS